jgi:DNA polymerase-3 subunit alpha
MKHSEFVHLHVHTQYSLLDGAIRIGDLFRKAKECAMPAIAITDHGNLFGAVDFYQSAYKAGIKPIIGCELYMAPKSRFEKGPYAAGEGARHLVVLARNLQGYKNIIKLTTNAYLEGLYYKPRIDKELLAECSEGLIGLSACLHGEIADLLLRGRREDAAEAAREYRRIFGEENFYLEIMENGIPEQKTANEELIRLARELSIPLVATNDCHYLNREDAEAHEVLLCIQTGKTIEDQDRMRFSTDHFYLKTPAEMIESFSYCPEAVENTVKIAERCNLTMNFDSVYLPHYKLDEDISLEDHLREKARQCLDGLFKTVPYLIQDGRREKYEKRLNLELDIINKMGFAGYFLIVSDFVNYAKANGIPVGPGRGSGAGSLVAYAIGITAIDPIRYKLFFERFLNPERKSMPDFDIDFCIEGRDDIIKYVTRKYGSENVAQIITFGTMQAKGVIRDVGRALNMPYGEVDRIAKLVPNILNISLDEAIRMEPRLQEEDRKNEKVRKLLTLSRSLEGLSRHSSTHAAGVVISDVPLVERVPLCKSPNDDIVTQFPMNDLQKVGLTKFDFLGLRTLTVIRDALRFIRENRGIDLDIDSLPLDDKLTYQLLIKGDTDGVFQLESSGMKEILVSMKPDCVQDVIALIALYRPGPLKSGMVQEFIARKQGRTKIVYELPQLEGILKETYGVILYQEQVMQIAVALAQYTMGQADSLRKAMGKKDAAEMEKVKPQFMAGTKNNKIPETKARKIFEQMETFAGYGFNKSHSAAYAMISYQTAYLKAHYPVEFMSALLTSEKSSRDKIIKHISGCRDMGIDILPPDINESMSDFSVSGDHIRFGLAAVKNVGVGAIESIISARESGGKFSSFIDFLGRVDLRRINKRVVESLIKCGAFDSLGNTRRELMDNYEGAIDFALRNSATSEQDSLFGTDEMPRNNYEIAKAAEWSSQELLSYEKEMLGFYITSHPLSRFVDKLKSVTDTDSETIVGRKDGDTVSMAGVVSGIRETLTKKKEAMAYITLEDMKGSVSVIVFSELYRSSSSILKGDEPVIVKGRADIGDESAKIVASEILPLSACIENPFGSVHFKLDSGTDPSVIDDLGRLLPRHSGKSDAYIHLIKPDHSETIIYLGKDLKLAISADLKEEADRLISPGETIIK